VLRAGRAQLAGHYSGFDARVGITDVGHMELLSMSTVFSDPYSDAFVDRRDFVTPVPSPTSSLDRRQFVNSHTGLSPDAAELANAIDHYKFVHRRRYIDYEEMLGVVKSLGYHKTPEAGQA
jgi:hypothetical protein